MTARFDDLLARLDDTPAPTDADRPAADLGLANNAVAQAMYSSSQWPDLGDALADAAEGDGRGLLALHDRYFDRLPDGTWLNTLEAFQVIQCADDPNRETPEEAQADLDEIRAVAPRMVPNTVAFGSCTAFPPADRARVDITGAGTGPVVVVGTTGDSATPLAGTRVMADAFPDGRLIVVDAEQHTGYGANECVTDLVDTYLVELVPPADETTCD